MRKMTLKFSNLLELASFSKLLTNGYLVNTCKLTITTTLDDNLAEVAINRYSADLIETTEKVFTY